MAKFKIILSDCPWSYRDKALAGKRGAECKYTVMSMEELKNLPVNKIADDDCILFLWITMPQLEEIFKSNLIESWGFKFKTTAFTWIKKNKKKDSLFMGMGNWTRSNPELCLLCVKGNPKRVNANVHSVIMSPIEGHSKKPDETRNKIIQLCGDLPRIELFAREKVDGWAALGYDIDGKDIRESLLSIMNK